MGCTACTEPLCLYKGALYLYLFITRSQTSEVELCARFEVSTPVWLRAQVFRNGTLRHRVGVSWCFKGTLEDEGIMFLWNVRTHYFTDTAFSGSSDSPCNLFLSVQWMPTDSMTQVSEFNSQHRHSDQTGSGAHPVSYPAARGPGLSLKIKRPEHKAYQPLSQAVKGKNAWRYTSIPACLYTMMFNETWG